MDSAHSEWFKTCATLQLSANLAQKWWSYLCNYYGNGRRYHTMNHISDMLNHFKDLKDKIQCFEEVSLAIFFHDIIYDPKACDNEEKSAAKFMEFVTECADEHANLTGAGIDCTRVHDMILMTKKHKTEVHTSTDPNIFGTDDTHYFLDSDMAILGQKNTVYRQYSSNIRKEYIHIDETLYRQRRRLVLQEIVGSPKIFATKHFYDLYEDAARANIEEEIASLSEQVE